ncbi:Crp/Fnr family transcriptional regulator [Spongiimicrobium salis]|uniref:Crp/Fnr family transcriptional regulator n=1 Tax=Spongiimicrobium salis TaxID=1667022 RepID=UPI00374DE202
MIEKLLEKMKEIIPVSDELWKDVQKHTKIMYLKRGEVLIPYSQVDTNAYLVVQGSFDASLISLDGSRKTIWFYFDGLFDSIVCMDSYFLNQPTKYEITALEDAIVFKVSKQEVDVLVEKYPAMNEFYRTDIIANFIKVDEIRNHMIAYTPKEFLAYLRTHYPEIFLRIPAKNIAHFMGITPEWYSKIQREAMLLSHKNE